MAVCPDCGLEFFLVEDSLEIGDIVQCGECGIDLEVASLEGEAQLELPSDDEDEEEYEEVFDDNGYYESDDGDS